MALIGCASAAYGLAAAGLAHTKSPAGGTTDRASSYLRRFAAMRADLPAGATVASLTAQPELSPDEEVLLGIYARAVHKTIGGGRAEPVPGLNEQFVREIADGFVAKHDDARELSIEQLREKLIAWWFGLAGGHQLAGVRFALAPHVVTEGPCDFIVGDFPPGVDHRSAAQRAGLVVIKDYGDGAVLFRNSQ